ncbi:MAG: hypothetical protein ACHREM_05240 [Polyangiales bacterium]
MRAVVTDKRPCRLGRGDIRRVPQERSYRGIVGYHVGCPRCGFVTAVLQGDNQQAITEDANGVVTFSVPARCGNCDVTIRLEHGELTTEEVDSAPHVR